MAHAEGEPPDAEETAEDVERARVRERRRKAGKRAGLTEAECELFADSDTPMPVLRRCLQKGATSEEIARIVI